MSVRAMARRPGWSTRPVPPVADRPPTRWYRRLRAARRGAHSARNTKRGPRTIRRPRVSSAEASVT